MPFADAYLKAQQNKIERDLGEERNRIERDKLNDTLKQREADRESKIQARYKEIGNTLYEAMLQDDESTRSTIIGALSDELKNIRGKPLSKTFVSWMTKNPEDAARVLENAATNGVSPATLFQLQDDPVLLSQGLIAMGRAKTEREARRQRGDGGGSTPTPSGPSQPQAAPSGQGLRLDMPVSGLTNAGEQSIQAPKPYGEQAPASATPTPSPTDARTQRIGSLTRRIDALRSMGRDEKEIKPLADERTELEKMQFELEKSGPVNRAKNDEDPVPADALAEAKAANPRLPIRPGMTYGELRKVMLGENATVRTPEQATTAKERAQRREQPLPEEMLRDPNVQRSGAATRGQFEDATTGGQGVRPLTADTLNRQKEQNQQVERVAGKAWEDIRTQGESARQRYQTYETLRSSLTGAGPTGALIGPARQVFMNVAQAFGAKPEALSAIQTAEAATLYLATQVLRDFSGPDSDRDFLRALEQSPGVRKTKGANDALIAIAQSEDLRRQEKAANANKWVSEYRSLASKDELGRTFDQMWSEHIRSKGPVITEPILRRLGLNPQKVWKQSPNDSGRQGP